MFPFLSVIAPADWLN